jgi:hypothetical protein
MNLFSLLFGKKTETTPATVEELAKEPVMSQPPPQEVDSSRWSDAHLKFLAGFLNGAEFKADERSYWANVLGQAPAKVVQRLIDAGLLTPAPLSAKLESAFKATEIKALLKERSLPVSGKKADAVARLVEADRARMEAKVAHITAYICTASGRELAEGYLAREEERNRQARERSFELLRSGQLRQASSVVAEYERAQVFARGVGVDWSQRPSPEDLQQLQAILDARPAILKDVSSNDWSVLQQAAAMMELWGERSAREWLPAGFVGASNLDPETAVRMVLFAGGHRAKLEQYRHAGCSRVEISGCGEGSCPVCQKLCGKKYRVAQVPELPHPDCTHEMGCRCMILPVFD